MKLNLIKYAVYLAVILFSITGCGENKDAKIQLKKEYELTDKQAEKKNLEREVDSLKKVLQAKKDSVAKMQRENPAK